LERASWDIMPINADAERLTGLAVELLGKGETAAAASRAREALRLDPVDLKALRVLAFALHTQGSHAESEVVYLRISELEPQQPLHWMNVGTARRCDGRIDEALYAFARAAALGAASADFYYNVGLAHIARDDFESARAVLEKALSLSPDDAEVRFRYAFCCYETLRTDEAIAALEGWETQPQTSPEIAASAGHLLMKLGLPERAEPAVRQAAAAGADPQARLTLIQLLERTNRIDEARRLLDQLLADPLSSQLGPELLLMQASLAQREGRHAAAAELFQKAVDGCPELHNKHFQQYPLAKSLDALGRHEEAFAVLQAAHQSQAAHLKLTAPLAALRGVPALSIAQYPCDPADIARWDHSGAPGVADSPVFIVAFPRSGTTLLEVALDAHPALKSMDEQPFLQNALDDLLALGVRYPAELAAVTPSQLEEVRRRYWARARAKVALGPQQRLIDKNPLNLLRLAVIKRLFPNAKILLAIRHPCDVLLSCYMQHFRAPDFVQLCQDLPTLTAGYRRAFDFWYTQQALLAADVLELRYETFVNSFESQIRQVVRFLELPWDDAALAPGTRAQEKRFISTPSYSQVVQPVTAKAVGRWLPYRAHFAECLPLLAPYFERWDYPA
jgi:tetratricopeptide (TPR) repeat protein